MPDPKKVLFLVPYPLHKAPSQRFRVELFLPLLKEKNIRYKIAPFLDENTWNVLYKNSSVFKKAFGVIKGFVKRIGVVLFVAPFCDYVFVHREASPLGPPVFEFIISKIFRKKLIYDFDDAIWISNTSKENSFVNWLKTFWKIKFICKWAYKVAGGNMYLCNYAKEYNDQVMLLPTSVDVEKQHNSLKDQNTDQVVIGWTGSHSTMNYLDDLVPVLKKIAEDFNTEIIIISNKPPQFTIPNLTFIPWREETEIDDLLRLNIGLMPLNEDKWSEGKCGFKLIQYMALGIPALASPVGVNKDIVEDGRNGFLCRNENEWYQALQRLIKDTLLRQSMGKTGREKITERYSIQANAETFLDLFN
jgi:glycosyltransferase involved in cell wall biosynthesis